ncbi:Uncharacterised protein [Mycobacterium tuberculosis]|nr:Uncharacterised protein [Mycobacterium tuberculosis]
MPACPASPTFRSALNPIVPVKRSVVPVPAEIVAGPLRLTALPSVVVAMPRSAALAMDRGPPPSAEPLAMASTP